MARRIFPQYSNRAFDNPNLTVARSGEFRQGKCATRLVGRNFGSARFGLAGLWIDRIFATWFWRSVSDRGARRRSHASRPLRDNRGPTVQSHVATRVIPLANIYRRKRANI